MDMFMMLCGLPLLASILVGGFVLTIFNIENILTYLNKWMKEENKDD